ncbi:MAG: exosortase S [Microbacteriaceae bacterium]|nr:exosortase S [Microbacteriaceae bacterium]
MSAAAFTPGPIAAGRQRPVATSIAARVLGIVLLLSVPLLALSQGVFRVAEAWVTRFAVDAVTDGSAAAAGNIVYFGIGSGSVTGLDITMLCSTAVLFAPVLALAGVLLLIPGFRASRIAVGLLAALALCVLVNMVRYASAAFAFQTWGMSGFDIIHRYAGSILVILGLMAALVLIVVFAVRSGRWTGPRRRSTWQPARWGGLR